MRPIDRRINTLESQGRKSLLHPFGGQNAAIVYLIAF